MFDSDITSNFCCNDKFIKLTPVYKIALFKLQCIVLTSIKIF